MEQPGTTKAARPKKGDGTDRDVGRALRDVYSQAVDESIPAEMLDLLNKLS